jgi:A/G-specific adenine glycosylase
MHEPSIRQIAEFREAVWAHYAQHGRQMPWREDTSPYKVLVSELMLQQTQVARVIPKFDAFIYTCPSFASLAEQPLSVVLGLWSGLGYNRRAKYLHQTACTVARDFNGQLPSIRAELESLPGIGKNTAGAILAYAFNEPAIFVETNIRTVLFHHLYPDAHDSVSDKELERLVELTLDAEDPRQWYWAMMDYGSYLKKSAGGRLRTSRHYVKQAPLKGSVREMRGRILKSLLGGALQEQQLHELVYGDERFETALRALVAEGFIERTPQGIRLTGAGQGS